MDAPDLAPEVLEESLRLVAGTHRILGGRRLILEHLPRQAPGRPLRVLDVGTGNADLPLALSARADVVGLDHHRQIVAIAGRRTRNTRSVSIVRGDATALPFPDGCFDATVSALTLHHLSDPDAAMALAEMARVSRSAVIVVDLERRAVHLLIARLLSVTLWRNDPLTRRDGPLSVRRAFTRDELESLAELAGLVDAVVECRLPMGLLLTARGGTRPEGRRGARAGTGP